MKALIVYDDATCAATTNAILHRASDHADISVKWDVRPWRLNMLRFTPTAEEAMSDAADADLIVFAIRNTRSVPTWLVNWLERWAVLRQSPGAALAVIGCGTAEASIAMRQFARRFGLNFIWEGQKPQLGVGFHRGRLNRIQVVRASNAARLWKSAERQVHRFYGIKE